MTVALLCEQALVRHAGRVAVRDGDVVLTYGALATLADRIASYVRSAVGLKRPRVAAMFGNRWEYLALDVACARHGLVLVRCNARDTADEVAHVLEDAEVGVFFFDEGAQEVAEAAVLRTSVGPTTHCLTRRGSVATVRAIEALASPAPRPNPAAVQLGDAYRIMYTSGSTGRPKGVVVTHDQWRAAVMEHMFLGPLQDLAEAGPDVAAASFLHVTPLSHVSGGLFWPFMLRGAEHVIADSTSPDSIANSVEQFKCTHTFLVPTLVRRLLSLPKAGDSRFASLRRIYYAASPIAASQLKEVVQRFGPIFAQGYGSTEAMWWLTYFSPEEHATALSSGRAERLTTCGRPSAGVLIEVLNDDGLAVQVGQLGEVATVGRHVAGEYVGIGPLPRIKGGQFDGWFRTGDIGYLDEDGYLHLMDRKSDLIISGGFNVYPRQIEEVLALHPAITECCIVGAYDEDWGEVVTAVLVGAGKHVLPDMELVSWLRGQIADYKLPRQIDWRETLPLNAAGKIDRKAIRSTYWSGIDRSI